MVVLLASSLLQETAGAVQKLMQEAIPGREERCGPGGPGGNQDVQKLMQEAIPGPELYTRHAVLLAPAAPLAKGGAIAAQAYAAMPHKPNGGPFTTTFTKVAIIGHAQGNGPNGISVGSDVSLGDGCDGVGLVDETAATFLRQSVPVALSGTGPPVLDCTADAALCPERSSPTITRQLPFLEELFSGAPISYRSLQGRVLPVMLQNRNATDMLAVSVGDAMNLLVGHGAPWYDERVLFVFGGDMSSGLPRSQASTVDGQSASAIVSGGTAEAAGLFTQFVMDPKRGGPAAVPRGYTSMLAGARTSELLGLTNSRVDSISDSAAFGPDPESNTEGIVTGYATILFWLDARPLGERMSAGAVTNTTVLATINSHTEGGQDSRRSLRSLHAAF